MIYSNKERHLADKEFSFGKVTGISIGEEGRGRKEIFLPSNVMLTKGINPELNLGTTKTGKPRINKDISEEVYLVINANGGYTRRGCGYIQTNSSEAIKIIATANGADGDAGRIGYWNDQIIQIIDFTRDLFFRIRYSGGCDSEILIVTKDKKFYEFENIAEFEIWLEAGNETDIDLNIIDFSERKFNSNYLTTI